MKKIIKAWWTLIVPIYAIYGVSFVFRDVVIAKRDEYRMQREGDDVRRPVYEPVVVLAWDNFVDGVKAFKELVEES